MRLIGVVLFAGLWVTTAMAREKSSGARAGIGGPKPKASKAWTEQASSFLIRHFAAEPTELPSPDAAAPLATNIDHYMR